jgi:DNA-binding NarL/FixJ family response regulator
MTVRVAVVEPLPMFARGLIATLDDEGYAADTPENVLQWARGAGSSVVVLTVVDGSGWALLADILRVRPDAAIVVVLASTDLGTYVRAVAAGAVGVLPRDASSVTVRDVVRAAVTGRCVLPIDILRSLVAGTTREEPARPLSNDEIEWLRQLADGSTVARLAERVGYSERMMFRMLADLYGRLGAPNRVKALMRARDEGWL